MNKKIITALLSIVAGITIVNAQINKGSVLLGGQFYYQTNDIEDPNNQYDQKSKSGTFNVAVGTAIKDNSIVGINLTYAPSSYDRFYTGSMFVVVNTKQYGVGVFNRQYKNLAKDFYFYAETGLAYTYFKRVDTDTLGANYQTIKTSGIQLSLTPGIAYKIFNKMYLEVMIPNIVSVQYIASNDLYQNVVYKQRQFIFNSSLNATSLSSLGVGFRFVL